MKLEDIKTPEDILEFMQSNIKYGWLDINNEEHIGNMKGFRSLYRTSSLDETLSHKIGTCIEQVYLMKTLLDKINVPNKMFCTRIYEGEDFDDLEADEHMHCFVLYYLNDKVYQIEHPNWERIGIYEYESEEDAMDKINEYYIEMAGGHARPITEFFEVEPNLTFKEFNGYINNLDKDKLKKVK
ncbi:MAG: transglutaminase domain-containing protein [Bacilli bacterium]|nr:transglutaminase domain-containing protein [Bacilli bacterium]